MLELVATMPSKPFGEGVLVTLDIFSRLIWIDYRCRTAPGVRGACNFLLYAKGGLRFHTAPRLSRMALSHTSTMLSVQRNAHAFCYRLPLQRIVRGLLMAPPGRPSWFQ